MPQKLITVTYVTETRYYNTMPQKLITTIQPLHTEYKKAFPMKLYIHIETAPTSSVLEKELAYAFAIIT